MYYLPYQYDFFAKDRYLTIYLKITLVYSQYKHKKVFFNLKKVEFSFFVRILYQKIVYMWS